MVDSLSGKSRSMDSLQGTCILQQFEDLEVEFQQLRKGVMLVNMSVSEPTFILKIKKTQL